MSAYTSLVVAHAAIGVVALAAFWLAAAWRKGTPGHRLVGRVYLLAMVGILLTGAPLAATRLVDGRIEAGAFLSYLLLLTGTGVWTSWRAIRDKHDPVAFTGPIYRVLAWSVLVGGLAVIALGLREGNALLIGFPIVGLVTGRDMLRKRAQITGLPRWWVIEHYSAMLGNGVATHIAFLAIGLPRLLPQVDGMSLHYVAWFGPVGAMLVAKLLLDRRWKVSRPAVPRGLATAG